MENLRLFFETFIVLSFVCMLCVYLFVPITPLFFVIPSVQVLIAAGTNLFIN